MEAESILDVCLFIFCWSTPYLSWLNPHASGWFTPVNIRLKSVFPLVQLRISIYSLTPMYLKKCIYIFHASVFLSSRQSLLMFLSQRFPHRTTRSTKTPAQIHIMIHRASQALRFVGPLSQSGKAGNAIVNWAAIRSANSTFNWVIWIHLLNRKQRKSYHWPRRNRELLEVPVPYSQTTNSCLTHAWVKIC